MGAPFRVRADDVDASTPASWPARRATRARSSRRWAATGSSARSRASCATARALLAVLPGGRGNDFARKLGIPFDPVEAAALLADRASSARVDLAEAGGDDVPRHPQRRDRLRRQPDRARDAPEARDVRLHLRRAARDRLAGKPGVVEDHARRRDRRPSTATPSRSATPACSAAGCTSRPTRRLDDGLLDVVLIADAVQARATCAGCRACSRARTCTTPAVTLAPVPRGDLRAPIGRSPPTPTATRSPSCP